MKAGRTKRSVITPRLRLEPIGPEHAEALWQLHQDDSIAEWYWEKWSKEKAARKAADMGRAWEVDGVSKWLAYDRLTDEVIGRGGLSIKDVDGAPRLEVGWAVLGDLWGQGYATEIGSAGFDFAFGDLDAAEVVAFTEPHNVRSRAVMEKLRMRFVRDIVWRGEPFVLYDIDRSTWERGRSF